jgi:autotransporter-associated beta strand protein
MKSLRSSWGLSAAAFASLLLAFGQPANAQPTRSLGIDVSAWQGNISAANWATLKRATNLQVNGVFGDGRDFVLIRSSRGGTTGYYDQNDANNVNGLNTLSQRYDDPYYVQNINRATAAGLLAGTYHFARPDIIASTANSGGIANSGADEADHLIQMAGPWLRPGYLLPVLDLESGQSQRTSAQLTTFCIDFSDRVFQVTGIRPMIYINGNYASYVQPSIVSAFPNLWTARWPNQSNPAAIDVQNGQPKDSYTPIYGPWDDPPNPANPWKIWQYASTAHVNAIGGGASSCDVDVAQGGIEFLKDLLVPAIWVTNADGNWATLANWNSGQTPIAPVQGPGQAARVGTLTMPTPRLPGSGDTVILDRPGSTPTITLNSGTHNIRKLYALETLNIAGGSLNVNYVPSADSTPFSAQFSAPVTLSDSGSLSVHTLQVDAARTFTLSGGSLTFNTLKLMPGATPASLVINGDIALNALSSTATISKGSGSGSSGFISLGGTTPSLNVASTSDISVNVPVSNGGLNKTGLGTLRLNVANSYAGETTINAGQLLVNNISGSGTGSGSISVNGGTLGGTGIISGPVTLNAGGTISPGTGPTMGTLTFNSAPIFIGTNFVKISKNGSVGPTLSDKLVLSSGTLTYGGTLVVSNTGAILTGGEAFTIFSAPAYAGAFGTAVLPPLANGLNWYLGDLVVNGSLKVNRSPVSAPLMFTNSGAGILKIPITALLSNTSDPDADTLTLVSFDPATTNGVTLSTDNTYIYYSNNVTVADRFTLTVGDGHGGSSTAVVNIAPSMNAQFVSHPNVNGNSVQVSFSGLAGATYYLERSTNLTVWQTISTNVMPSNGLLDFVDDFHDLNAPPSSAFYRLSW